MCRRAAIVVELVARVWPALIDPFAEITSALLIALTLLARVWSGNRCRISEEVPSPALAGRHSSVGDLRYGRLLRSGFELRVEETGNDSLPLCA